MTGHDRRAFLKKLAKGAAYSAPAIVSMSAPVDLVGQGQSSEHKHGGGGGGHAALQGPRTAPWDAPPPGSTPP